MHVIIQKGGGGGGEAGGGRKKKKGGPSEMDTGFDLSTENAFSLKMLAGEREKGKHNKKGRKGGKKSSNATSLSCKRFFISVSESRNREKKKEFGEGEGEKDEEG